MLSLPRLLFGSLVVWSAAGCTGGDGGGPDVTEARDGPEASGEGLSIIHVGHFPNVPHAPALIGRHFSRQEAQGERERGWFEERLGGSVTIRWQAFNAGPSAMAALAAGSIDMTYVGPNPTLEAHARSGGLGVRILAGAASGGSALVVRDGATVSQPADLRGAKLATPQLGSTQDIRARAWLVDHGLRGELQGGDVAVLPTSNPDQLELLGDQHLDAAWTVEPWVARLETVAGASVLVEDNDSVSALLVSSTRFLERSFGVAQRFVQAHEELTAWIHEHPLEARTLVAKELLLETTLPLSTKEMERAWSRVRFSTTLEVEALKPFIDAARKIGLLGDLPEPGLLFSKETTASPR